MNPSTPSADPSSLGIQTFGSAAFTALRAQAVAAERRRAHLNLHSTPDAPVQRLFIATEPGTYMRPHRHPENHKWEFFVVLRGRLDLLVFDESGELRERVILSPERSPAAEVPPGVYHAYVCMADGTLGLEVKEGAYIPTPEKDFAPWSPAERSSGADAFVAWMHQARSGDRAPQALSSPP